MVSTNNHTLKAPPKTTSTTTVIVDALRETSFTIATIYAYGEIAQPMKPIAPKERGLVMVFTPITIVAETAAKMAMYAINFMSYLVHNATRNRLATERSGIASPSLRDC